MHLTDGVEDSTAIALTVLAGATGVAALAIVFTLMALATWGGGIF